MSGKMRRAQADPAAKPSPVDNEPAPTSLSEAKAEDAKAKTSGVKSFLSGGFGGICCVIVGQPFDFLKVRMQTASPGQYTGTLDCLRQAVAKGGPFALFRGMTSPLVGVTPMFAISFWGYAQGKNIVYALTPSRTDPTLSLGEYAFAGAFSAVPQTIVTTPVERVKVVLQTDSAGAYKGPGDAIAKMYAEGGIKSLYRGTIATLARDAPGSATYFVAYETLKKSLTKPGQDPSQLNIGTTLLAGGGAGVAMWTIAIPPDVIKSRLQSAPTGTYSGFMDCARQMIAKDGVKSLFKGFGPAMLRAFPANAATFLGVEFSMSLMNKCVFEGQD